MPHKDKPAGTDRDSAKATPRSEAEDDGPHHLLAQTSRPATPELEGGTPLPEELTGRATGTREDLTSLFDDVSPAHLAYGFRGGSADDSLPADDADGTGHPKNK
jgi:hypothetical protein